jgi:hypothetical protein
MRMILIGGKRFYAFVTQLTIILIYIYDSYQVNPT